MAEKHGMHVAQAHSNTRKCEGCEASRPLHQAHAGANAAQAPPAVIMNTPNTQHQSVRPAFCKPGLTHTKEAGTVPAEHGTKKQPAGP